MHLDSLTRPLSSSSSLPTRNLSPGSGETNSNVLESSPVSLSHEATQEANGNDGGSGSLIGGLQKTYGDQKKKGPEGKLHNYSAELTRDCVALLSMLGQQPMEPVTKLDMAKELTAGPEAADGSRAVQSLDKMASSNRAGARRLVAQIRRGAVETAAKYGTGLPTKVAGLYQQAMNAASQAGLA